MDHLGRSGTCSLRRSPADGRTAIAIRSGSVPLLRTSQGPDDSQDAKPKLIPARYLPVPVEVLYGLDEMRFTEDPRQQLAMWQVLRQRPFYAPPADTLCRPVVLSMTTLSSSEGTQLGRDLTGRHGDESHVLPLEPLADQRYVVDPYASARPDLPGRYQAESLRPAASRRTVSCVLHIPRLSANLR
jgi:hypothetical protein